MNNSRNEHGIKDADKGYRKGGWEQWTDMIQVTEESNKEIETLEEAKEVMKIEREKNPTQEYKHTKLKDGLYRIYSR